jgi:hypothetical protein
LSGCAHPESATTSNIAKPTSHKNDKPEDVWNSMKACLKAGDISGAISYYSVVSKDKYQEAFHAMSKDELHAAVSDFGAIKPDSVEADTAQYYFEKNINGQKITFPIEFVKEDGQWKIMEY